MIPIFVTIQGGLSFETSKKILRGHMSGEEAGIACKEDGDSVVLSEPFNGTSVSLSRRGLNAISVILGGRSVHVLGNYELAAFSEPCCVELCGTTACGMHVCITCERTTACC